jgi:amino acid adenylation domain-containing protein/non-ribosomal peptide synthase protein (TIGR01720 family)
LELVIGLFGILKAGGAYLPLDPALPKARLAFMLEDAQAPVLLTQSSLKAGLPETKATVVYLDAEVENLSPYRSENLSTEVGPENLAYVIYTSGSTGQPKGTMIVHQGLVNYLVWCTKAYQVDEGSGAPVHLSIGFDASITSLFSPLLAGQRLWLLPEKQEIEALSEALVSERDWSFVKLTPAHLEILNTLLPQEKLKGLPHFLILGGEALTGKNLSWWTKYAHGTRIINEYGPTETVVGCCVYEVSEKTRLEEAVPIGCPIANTQLYILDNALEPVPIGVQGELHIGGTGVARGYLNRPELTAEKFIQNPFSDDPNARLYKTGDLARYLPDGNIEYLGRIDNQVKIRGFRIELGEIEAVLGQHPIVRENAVIVPEGSKRLIAYWAPHPGQVIENAADLRDFLKERLPDYMIPSAFVTLDALPLTPNGKIDRRALSQLSVNISAPTEQFVAPRNLEEKLLADIWTNVLNIERVGVHENFFELGGDSIISIQVISRANQAGLKLTPRQIFQHQTIAELATEARKSSSVTPQAEQGLVIGKVPLTPIQHWFFEQHVHEPHYYNQSVLLEVSPKLTPELLEPIVSQLLRHHDALRLRFSEQREQVITDDYSLVTDTGSLITVKELSELTLDEQRIEIETTTAELQASLNLDKGPLLRVALFQLGDKQANRLFFVIHHLAVDGVSWRILLEDVTTAYQQLCRDEVIALPPKTTSFKQWARHLTEYAQSETLAAELDYWLAKSRVLPLPVDYPSKDNTNASTARVSVSLDAKQTQALLQEVPSAYNTQINDVLLTALVQSFARWTGSPILLLDLEGHGREELFEDIDLSRTVGWFTTIYPVLLELNAVSNQPGEVLKYIKEQLRQIPKRGIGYGLLRYLNSKAAKRLQALPQAQVSFNYLGQFHQTFSAEPLLGTAKESSGDAQSQQGYRHHLLDINGLIHEGQLLMDWSYSENIHSQATIERLAQHFITALQTLIAHCQSPEAGGYTPSDFPDVRLSQEQLERVLDTIVLENQANSINQKKNIEAIYPLSPSQQGMLIETLAAPQSGIHVEQSILRLHGNLDLTAFEQAWQRVLERHSVLRTAFLWQDFLEEPVQFVLKNVRVPLKYQDWRGIASEQQQAQLEAYIKTERVEGFNFSKAPLLHLAVFQVEEQTYDVVWTHHHILMDGWCINLIQTEMLDFFEAYRHNQSLSLEPTRPYQDYIRWLKQQDLAEGEAFWQQTLQGFTKPTPLGIDEIPPNLASKEETERYSRQQARMTIQETAALQSLVQQHHLTLNNLIQGLWALLLSRYSSESDVVFGATVSGRPSELTGVEFMVGLFINTLPVRVKVIPKSSLWPWLAEIQVQNQERGPYEYCSAGQVHQWSDMPGALPLYESILVFENYPVDESSIQQACELDLDISEGRSVGAQTQYALTILVTPSPQLSFQMVYDCQRFNHSDTGWILEHFVALLKSILAEPELQLEILLDRIPTSQIPKVRASQKQQAGFVAPRDALELQLAQIWENILNVHPIGVHDNFFELGGHSLLAVSLMTQIGQQFNKHLPLATLFQGATIEQLATLLRTETLSWSPLVTVQSNGSKRPFFCVPGGGGNVLYLYELARHLGTDQPFYGLQSVGLDGQSKPYTRIEDMAARYIKEIQTVQPEGPYLLGGHSFGGPVAFEMSQQLQKQGHEVALLAILDTTAPLSRSEPKPVERDDTQVLVDIATIIEQWSGKSFEISYETLQPLGDEEQLNYLYERLKATGVVAQGNLAFLRGYVAVHKAIAQVHYVPSPDVVPTRIVLFKAEIESMWETTNEELLGMLSEPSWGWSQFSKGTVEVHVVPGDHHTMVNPPHVQVLAEQLKVCLEQ